MTARLVAFLAAFAWLASAASAATARVVYVGVEGDPHYEPHPVYTGLSLKDLSRPLDGARLAFRGTRILERALGVRFELEERLLEDASRAPETVRAARESGALAVLLDLPEADMRAVLAVEGGKGLIFNIRHARDRWRGPDCDAAMLHTMPSRAMLADALAQHLRSQGWTDILLLAGDGEADRDESEAVRRSAEKFGLQIVAEREFVLTNDPRRRDLSNIALLTGPPVYDVIWLIDAEGEFGRYVPYASHYARPVVGSEGLGATAWHWTWERHGAPQLNQRFKRLADREMGPADWAAWAAARAVIEAVSQTRSVEPSAVADAIRADGFALDLYKGVRGSFRKWDGQLRQPILLATHNAVIGLAPLAGFEHRLNTLDTLGYDEAESPCTKRAVP
jgi:ABC transporter substrate binding protein (PQQ-dependent alcohol dehydrogenase system)